MITVAYPYPLARLDMPRQQAVRTCGLVPNSKIMISDFASGILAGLAVAMPIGAVGSYLVGLGARERISVATAAALGVASVDGGYAVVAAVGGAGLQALVNEASDWLEWVATVVLAAVAVRTLLVALRRYRSIGGRVGRPGMLSPARAYFSLVALTALNPATLITFAAVVIGRSQSGGNAAWPASRAVRGRRFCGIGCLATNAHRKWKSARPGAEQSSRATRDLGLLSAHHAGPGRGVTAELSPIRRAASRWLRAGHRWRGRQWPRRLRPERESSARS